MTPFISSVKANKRVSDGRNGLISVVILSLLLISYFIFVSWSNKYIKAKQQEKKAISEQVENSNKV